MRGTHGGALGMRWSAHMMPPARGALRDAPAMPEPMQPAHLRAWQLQGEREVLEATRFAGCAAAGAMAGLIGARVRPGVLAVLRPAHQRRVLRMPAPTPRGLPL